MNDGPTALRCRICLTNWPADPAFMKCPECEEACSPSWQENAISMDEALSRGRWAAFQRYQEKRGDDAGDRPAVSVAEEPL